MNEFIGGIVVGILLTFVFYIVFVIIKSSFDNYIGKRIDRELNIWEEYQLRKSKEGKK